MNYKAFAQAPLSGQSRINDTVSTNDHSICFITTAAQTFLDSLSLSAVVSIHSFRRGFGVGNTGIPQCSVWKTQTHHSSLAIRGPMAVIFVE